MEPNVDPVARLIALVSAAVAIISLGWAIHVGRRDNPSIKVTVSLAYVGHAQARSGPYIAYRVANSGRRPVTITEVGLTVPPTKLVIRPLEPSALPYKLYARNLPHELTENTSISYLFPAEVLTEDQRQAWREPPLAYVADAVGRMHTATLTAAPLQLLWPAGSYAPLWQVWKHHRWQFWRWRRA